MRKRFSLWLGRTLCRSITCRANSRDMWYPSSKKKTHLRTHVLGYHHEYHIWPIQKRICDDDVAPLHHRSGASLSAFPVPATTQAPCNRQRNFSRRPAIYEPQIRCDQSCLTYTRARAHDARTALRILKFQSRIPAKDVQFSDHFLAELVKSRISCTGPRTLH